MYCGYLLVFIAGFHSSQAVVDDLMQGLNAYLEIKSVEAQNERKRIERSFFHFSLLIPASVDLFGNSVIEVFSCVYSAFR